MFCSNTVLPVRGGETINARCPLPIGATMSMTRAERSFLVVFLVFHLEPLVGVERCQVVGMTLWCAFSGSSKLIVLTLSSAK